MFRAQEMARYVERGILDAGLTGLDWIAENDADVVEVEDLVYSKNTSNVYRWVVAVPEDSDIHTVQDLEGKRIATELVQATERYLARHGVSRRGRVLVGRDRGQGAPAGRRHRRGHRDRLFAARQPAAHRGHGGRVQHQADRQPARRGPIPGSEHKIEILAILLRGALEAEAKVGLKMNVPRAKLDEVSSQLPALHTPTISGPDRPRLGRAGGDRRRGGRARHHPRAQACGRRGDHRVPAEQGDLLADRGVLGCAFGGEGLGAALHAQLDSCVERPA